MRVLKSGRSRIGSKAMSSSSRPKSMSPALAESASSSMAPLASWSPFAGSRFATGFEARA